MGGLSASSAGTRSSGLHPAEGDTTAQAALLEDSQPSWREPALPVRRGFTVGQARTDLFLLTALPATRPTRQADVRLLRLVPHQPDQFEWTARGHHGRATSIRWRLTGADGRS